MTETKTKISIQFQLIIIFFIAFIVYSNTLSNPFVWDDIYLIEKNKWLDDFSNVKFAFTKDYLETSISIGSTGYYRPIIIASFFLNHLIDGKNPFIYHFTNVIIHSINSVLLCIFLYLLFNNFLLAYISALIFAVHPIHTESVSFIAGRTDVFALMFYLLSLICFIKFDNIQFQKQKSSTSSVGDAYMRPRYYILSLIFMTLATLSKEISVTILLIIILIIYFKREITLKNLFRKHSIIIVPYLLIIIIFFILKYFILHISAKSSADILPFGQRILSTPYVILLYIHKLFIPINLITAYNPEIINNYLHLKFLIPLLIIVILTIFSLLNAPRKSILSFSILWFIITIIPVTNIIPLFSIYAERYLYIPSISASIIIYLLLSKISNIIPKIKSDIKYRTLFTYFLSLLIIIIYSNLTLKRNLVWGNETELFRDSITKSKNNARAYANLFLSYIYNYNEDEAFKTYNEVKKLDESYKNTFIHLAIKLFNNGYETEAFGILNILEKYHPNDTTTINTLATLYLNKGFYEKAHDLFYKSLELNPKQEEILFNIGYAYFQQQDYISASKYLQKSLSINSSYLQSLNLMGIIYEKNKMFEEAENCFLKAIDASKRSLSSIMNLMDFYLRKKEYKKVTELGKSIKDTRNIKNKHFFLTLGSAYLHDNNLEEALKHFQKSLQLDRNDSNIYFNIAFVYDIKSDYQNAIINYNKALRLNPNDINILNNLAILYAKLNKKSQAKDLWEKALKLNPDDKEIKYNLDQLNEAN